MLTLYGMRTSAPIVNIIINYGVDLTVWLTIVEAHEVSLQYLGTALQLTPGLRLDIVCDTLS